MSDTSDLEADRKLLRRAVTAAGAVALEQFRAGPGHWHKAPGQVLTEADLAIDRLLYDILIGARPEDGWLSEERADDGSRHRRRRVWIVDPIDGTRAFADGEPEFAISIALAVDGEAVLGAVLNPATEEHFEAQRDAGARLNGASLRISEQRELTGARLLSSRTEMRRRDWPQLIPGAQFTTMGSLAYKLALVAAGRFDGLVSLRASHDWDLAAAALLIGEAGGRISGADGAPLLLNQPTPSHAGIAAAGTTALHRALVNRLRSVEGG
ncbi:MAG: suhB [Geminicoccaceae bacterium]|nr:suhB [Geminicoccaceae bacterium]